MIDPKSYHEEAPQIDFNEFKKVVESRRSVRRFTKEAIPEPVVREALRMALLAPTSSNLQSWEFYWVRNPQKKKELAQACLNQSAAKTAQELIVCVARMDTWRRNAKLMVKELEKTPYATKTLFAYYQKLVPIVYSVGFLGILSPLKCLLVNLWGLFRPMVRAPVWPSELKAWASVTTSLACENLMLAFRAQGYDTCPMEGFDEVRVKKLLHLKSGAHVVMVISAGKRAQGGIYGYQIRLDPKNFIFEV